MSSSPETLRTRVAALPAERVVWVDREGRSLAAGCLREGVDRERVLRAAASGRNVAVFFANDLDVAAALVLLDGTARQILLLGHGVAPAVTAEFLRRTDTHVVFTDTPAAFETSLGVGIAPCRNLVQAMVAPRTGSDATAAPFASHTTRWIVPTSGTSGTPKLVAHTLGSLARTCKSDLDAGVRYVWGLLYGVTRFAGLQVFLQGVWGGSRLVFVDRSRPVSDWIRLLVAQGCNCLSATPSLWRRILMAPESQALLLRQVTLGGEIADAKILAALRRAYPSARLVHIYASTEAGVAFAVGDGRAGFPVGFLESPPPGVRIRVADDGHLFVAPERPAHDLVGCGASLFGPGGWIDTGDLVRIEGDRIFFLGRENGTLNVGGQKLQPEEVVSVLVQHEAVALARVKPRPSSMLGSVVEADVVLAPGFEPSDALRKIIQLFCRSALAPFKVPAFLNFVDEIRLSDSGKPVQSGACEEPMSR